MARALLAAQTSPLPLPPSPADVIFDFIAGGGSVQVWANYRLGVINTAVTRAVIVVHGANQDADNYYARVRNPAQSDGSYTNTIILAPRFGSETVTGRLRWGSGWRDGDLSVNGSPRTSSYTVLDLLANAVLSSGAFPNMTKLVVTGHSAGAQVVGRYAMGTTISEAPVILFVPANPSSWAYLVPERPTSSPSQFTIPSNTCSGTYNNWKFGLLQLNTYMSAVGATSIKINFRTREVVYFLGTSDTNPNDADLDTSCPAMRQGPHRYFRGTAYYNHLALAYGSTPSSHSLRITSCGHSSTCMFDSTVGRQLLFH